jgi:hypothetical protein
MNSMQARPDFHERPAPAHPPGRMLPLAWLLLALSALVCVVWFIHALGYWEDDAYIHLEFARSVATGRGFSFNGHVVYGDTSPLWVWLLASIHAVIPGPLVAGWIVAGKTLTALAAVFALAGAFVFSRSVTPSLSPAASSLFAAAMVLVFVTNPYFGYWAFSGMEALAAAGLVCWGAAAVSTSAATLSTSAAAAPLQALTPARFLLAALAAGIAPLLRPEMIFFTLLLGLVLLVDLIRAQRQSVAERLALLVAGLVLIGTPALLWARYAIRTFGMVVPNTNAAKRAGPHDSIVLRLVNLYTFGFPVIVIGLLLFAVWLVWYVLRGRREGAAPVSRLLHAGAWLLFVWTAINCIFYVVDHTYVQTRYIFVTAPVLTIAILAIAAQRWPSIYRGLVAFALVFGVTISALTTWPLIRNKVQVDRIYAQLAVYLRTLPPDAPVAHYSIGEAAFLSQHPIVDTGGITRPGIIAFLGDATDDRRQAWIYSQGAKYEVVDHSPVPGATLVWSRNLPSTGWFLNPREYHTTELLQVWKLPPEPAALRALLVLPLAR